MKKRTLSLLLTLVMLLSLCPAMTTTAAAANPAAGYHDIQNYDARPLVEHSWLSTDLFLRANSNKWCVFYADAAGTAGDYLEDATFSVAPGSPELEIELVRDWQNDSDEPLITTDGHPVWLIRAKTIGDGTLFIESDGVTYELPYTVHVPERGFFASTDRTAESYLGETFLYDDSPANRTFYYLSNYSLTIKDVFIDYTEGSFANGDLEWSIAPDGRSVAFTIPAGKAPEGRIGFGIDIEWDGGGTNTWFAEINLSNNVEALRYHEVWFDDDDQPYLSDYSLTTLNLGVDYGARMVFFHGTADNAVELKNPTVTSSDRNILRVQNVYNEPGVGTVVRVVGNGLGTVTLTVESEGKTYTMPVTVRLPDMGLYTKQNPIPANFVYPYVYTSTQDTVLWAMTENGWQDPVIEKQENRKGHVDLELVERANKLGYYDVKVTIPKGQGGEVGFYFRIRESNGHGWGTDFWLTDNTPGLISQYVDYWDGEVHGWSGYNTRLSTSPVGLPFFAFHYGTVREKNPIFANSLAEAPALQVTGENGKPAPMELVPVDIGTVSNSDLVIYEGKNLQLGSGTISATVDGSTYSMPIEVGMPQFYPYTRNEYVEDAILFDNAYDSTRDTELWLLTERGLQNPSLSRFQVWQGDVDWEFVERANKPGYYDVKLTIPKDTAGEVEWRIEVQSDNYGSCGSGMWLEDVAVRTRVDYAYMRDNEFQQEDWRYSLLNMALDGYRDVVLYYGSPDEAYVLTDIQFDPPAELTVEKRSETTSEGNPVHLIHTTELGRFQLPYTAQYTNKYGQTVQVSDYLLIDCGLPEFYPYTQREISVNAYSPELVYTSGEDNVFWLMTEDGYEGKPSIELENYRGRVEAEAVERPDKPGYYDIKLTIPATTSGYVHFHIHVRGNNGGWGRDFEFEDAAPHLAYRWAWWEEGPDGNSYLVESDEVYTGPLYVPLNENNGMVLYYGSPTIGYKPVSSPTMDLNDAPEVTITPVDGSGPAVSMTANSIVGQESRRVLYRLRGKNQGLSVMSVTIDGETYSMQVVGQMPNVGFYSTDTISEETLLKDWTFPYSETERSFYLIAQPGGTTLDSVKPIYYDNDSPKDFLTVEKVNNKTWKLTVKDGYDFDMAWLDVEFVGTGNNGDTRTSRWGVCVANGTESVRFADFYIGPDGPTESDRAFKDLNLWVGDSYDLIFNYGSANNYAPLTNITSVTPVDPALLSVKQVGSHTVNGVYKPVYRIRAKQCLSADENNPTVTALTIIADGKTYTFPITVYPITAGSVSYNYLFWDDDAQGYYQEAPSWLRLDEPFSSAPYMDMHAIALFYSPDGMSVIPVEATVRPGTAYDMVAIEEDGDGNPVTGWYEISAFDFTSGYLDVVVNGQTYSLPVETHMPYLGFYSHAAPNKDTFRMYQLMEKNTSGNGYQYYTELYTVLGDYDRELAPYHKFFALQKQYDADGYETGLKPVDAAQFKAEILSVDAATKTMKVGLYSNVGDLLVYMNGFYDKDEHDYANEVWDSCAYRTYVNLLTPNADSSLFVNLSDNGFAASKFLPRHLFRQAAAAGAGITASSTSYNGSIRMDAAVVQQVLAEMNNGSIVRLEMKSHAPTSAQNEALQQVLPSGKKVLTVLDTNLLSNDTRITNCSGTVTVSYPCDLPDGTEVLICELVDGATAKGTFSGTYSNGYITFETRHLTSFAIVIPVLLPIPEEMLQYPDAVIFAAFYNKDGAMVSVREVPAGAEQLELSAEEQALSCRLFCLNENTYIPMEDVGYPSNYPEAVRILANTGLLMDSFAATQPFTRGMAAQMVCRLVLGPDAADALTASEAPFSDIPADDPYAGYIAYAKEGGIISGYSNGTFRPDNQLSGYAVMKMLICALGYDAVAEGLVGSNWDLQTAKMTSQLGLTDGLNKKFTGSSAVTSEDACLFIMNTLKAQPVAYPTNPPEKGTAAGLSRYPSLSHMLFGVGADNLLGGGGGGVAPSYN